MLRDPPPWTPAPTATAAGPARARTRLDLERVEDAFHAPFASANGPSTMPPRCQRSRGRLVRRRVGRRGRPRTGGCLCSPCRRCAGRADQPCTSVCAGTAAVARAAPAARSRPGRGRAAAASRCTPRRSRRRRARPRPGGAGAGNGVRRPNIACRTGSVVGTSSSRKRATSSTTSISRRRRGRATSGRSRSSVVDLEPEPAEALALLGLVELEPDHLRGPLGPERDRRPAPRAPRRLTAARPARAGELGESCAA